jgi:hypothetical protein
MRASCVLLSLAWILLAVPAAAVTVTIEVKDSGGNAVAGAEIDLGLGGPPVTTNAQGLATADVSDDQMGRRVTVAIAFGGGAGQSRRTVRRSVTLAPNVQLEVPSLDVSPERRFGCRSGGGVFQFGGGLGYSLPDHAPLTSQSFEFGRTVNGNPLTTFARSGNTPDADLDQINETDDKHQRFINVPDFSATVPLPELWGRRPCDIPGLMIIPTVEFGFERADVRFESDVVPPGLSQNFTGDGLGFRIALGTMINPDDTPWFLGVGFEHRRIGATEVTRSRPVSDFFTPPARTLSDDAEYQARTNGVRITVGYALSAAVPYAGLAHTRFRSNLRLDSEIDITPANTTSVLVHEQLFENTFRKNYTQVIGGVNVQVAGPIAAGVEARFGGGKTDVLARAIFLLTQ